MASTADGSPTVSTSNIWEESLKELLVHAIEETKDKLGDGSYGEAQVVKVKGVRCSGKRIHAYVFALDTFRERFVCDCLTMSTLRHPNIVQMIGVHLQSSIAMQPVVLSELLPISLSEAIRRYGYIPQYSKRSILLDIAHGLRYIHELEQPIVHGHLIPNNVLLTASLQAKLSDVVRFGTQPPMSVYVPTEKNGTSTDIFSLGNICILVTIQRDPSPLVEKDHSSEGGKVVRSEVQRREKFLAEMEDANQLKELTIKCLETDGTLRPTAAEFITKLEEVVTESSEFNNILEMLTALGQYTLEKQHVASLNRVIEGKDEEIEAMKQQIEPLKQEIEAKELAVAAQKEETDACKLTIRAKEERVRANDTALRAKDALIKAKDRELAAKKQQLNAKESHLKSISARIDVLEHQVAVNRRQSRLDRSPSCDSQTPLSPVHSEKDFSGNVGDEVNPSVIFRKGRGRKGKSAIASDGYMFQNWKAKNAEQKDQVDPKLAGILSRQKQRIEASTDSTPELVAIQEQQNPESAAAAAADKSSEPDVKVISTPPPVRRKPQRDDNLQKRKSCFELTATQ